LDHPGRRVATFDTYYYIMSRQYLCVDCKKTNDDRKKAAGGQPFEKIQYTTMGYHDESLKNLPKDLFYKFPAVLSHRTGLDRSLAHSLRPLMDRGIRTKGISDWLLELHSLRYTSDYIAYELRLERKLAFSRANDDPPMFSKFNDRKLYNGAVPSSAYLSQVYKKEHESIRPHLNQENKKISMEQLNIDASYKAPKKLSQHHGKRVYETLQTATNEIGQIRVQALTGSDSHEQLDPALTAMSKTMQERGQKGPSIAFTDNPSRDKVFLMQKFESLRKKQAELDAFASKLNAADSDSDSSALDATVDARLPRAGSSAFQATQQGVDNAINSQSFQVVESRDINDKIDAMREQVEEDENAVYAYGLDCEWDTEPCRSGEGRRKVGKVALMQISYTTDGSTKALLLRLPRKDKLPN
jgi:hypothetical protein